MVSCATLSYWHADRPAPTYRHRLGLRADLIYHDDADESPQILIDFTAAVALLATLTQIEQPDQPISLDEAARAITHGVHITITSTDPPAAARWYLQAEPAGWTDLTATHEPWYPVPADGCDQVVG